MANDLTQRVWRAMKAWHLVAVVTLVLGLTLGLAVAQTIPGFPRPLRAVNFETVTVDGTAGGVALTTAKVVAASGPAELATITVTTAQVRCTIDGTAPTSTVGHVFNAGDRFEVVGNAHLAALRCIRTTGTSGELAVTYSRLLP